MAAGAVEARIRDALAGVRRGGDEGLMQQLNSRGFSESIGLRRYTSKRVKLISGAFLTQESLSTVV
jgi:hypothetical protein